MHKNPFDMSKDANGVFESRKNARTHKMLKKVMDAQAKEMRENQEKINNHKGL